ncbi:MAG: SurA N-terminal domain-containing protein [Pseudomonadota bacterium]
MLDFFRRGVKTWVAKALLALLILSFAVWGIGGEIFSFSMRTAIARVGDTKITAEQFYQSYTREQNRLSQQAGEQVDHGRLRDLGVDDAVLRELVRNAALKEELAGFGVRVSDAAAMEAIRMRPEFQTNGEFSPQLMRITLGRMGMTDGEFIDSHRDLVGRNLLTSPAVAPTRSPPGMAARIAAFQGETRRISTVTMPLEFASDPGQPGEAEIRGEYEASPARYTEPERRFGSYLHISIEDLVAENQPSEAEVRTVYDDEIERFRRPATRTLDQIPMPDMAAAAAAVARLQSGDITFEDLAAELETDLTDTDLGTVTEGELPETTDRAIFAATEPGILDPVDLPVGAAIIRLREVNEASTLAFEEVRDILADRIARDIAFETAPDLANRVEEMQAEGATISEISAATGVPISDLGGLGSDGTWPDGAEVPAVLTDPSIRREVFEALDAEERAIVETSEGGFFTVMVDEIRSPGLRPLEEVRSRVITDWQRRVQLEELAARANRLANLVSGGGSLSALAPALGLSVAERDPFTRLDPPTDLPTTLIAQIFSADTGSGFSATAADLTGVIIAEVTASISMPAEVTAETANQIEGLVEQTVRADELDLLTRAIVDGHEASTDPAALDQMFTRISGHGTAAY